MSRYRLSPTIDESVGPLDRCRFAFADVLYGVSDSLARAGRDPVVSEPFLVDMSRGINYVLQTYLKVDHPAMRQILRVGKV